MFNGIIAKAAVYLGFTARDIGYNYNILYNLMIINFSISMNYIITDVNL